MSNLSNEVKIALLQGQLLSSEIDGASFAQPSNNSSLYKEKIYQVFKTEQHYFEIVVKLENENFIEHPIRRIVRYIDIGYHIGMEVWTESSPQFSQS